MQLFILDAFQCYLKEDNGFINTLSKENLTLLIEKLSPLMDPFDTFKYTERIISVLMSKKKTGPFKNTLFSVMSSDLLNGTTYKIYIVVETTEQFQGYIGLISDNPLQKNLCYSFIDTRLGEQIPKYPNKKPKKMLFLPNNTIHFNIDFYNSIIKIQGKSEWCQFPIVSQANFVNKLRIFIDVISPCKLNSIKVTTAISVKENFPNYYCMIYVPSSELYHQNGSLKKLIDIHNKLPHQPEYRKFLNNYYRIPDKYDLSFTSPQYNTFPILK